MLAAQSSGPQDFGFERLQSSLQSLSGATSAREIFAALNNAATAFRAQYFFFLYFDRRATVSSEVKSFDNAPRDWRESYINTGLFALDRAVEYAKHGVLPQTFYLEDGRFFGHGSVRIALRKLGIVSGVLAPVQGCNGRCGYLALSWDDEHDPGAVQRDSLLPRTLHTGVHIFEAVDRIYTQREQAAKRTNNVLSPRETEVLKWAAAGKTAWETGVILGVAERTVVFHLANAQHKLKANNKQQTVARAIAMGLLAAPE